MSYKDPCCVVDQHCTHPANLETTERLRAKCFACDHRVCLSCSLRVAWYSHGRRRICHNCLCDNGREAEVMRHIERMSGYQTTLPARLTASGGIRGSGPA